LSNHGELELILFSFDARFPSVVVDHIRDLVSNYIHAIKWITTFSPYRLQIQTIKLDNVPLTIGPPGVTETSANDNTVILFNRGNQAENYTELEWEAIEEADMDVQRMNLRTGMIAMKEGKTIHQLEQFDIYIYQSTGIQHPAKQQKLKTCIQCGDRAVYQCGDCKEAIYCGKQCQTQHWRMEHKFECKQRF